MGERGFVCWMLQQSCYVMVCMKLVMDGFNMLIGLCRKMKESGANEQCSEWRK